MTRWTYPILAAFILLVLSFGLLITAKEGIEVAGLVSPDNDPEKGRLMLHLKNTTRLQGDAGEIYSKLREGNQYKVAQTADFPPTQANWKQFVEESISFDPSVPHSIAIGSKGEDALSWALPGIYYAKYNDSQIVFLEDLEKNADQNFDQLIYYVGPNPVPRELNRYDNVVPITGDSPAELAVNVAKYRDENTDFGWGRTHERRNGYFQYVMIAPEEALQGLAALSLAKSNSASLLFTDAQGGIPAITDSYVWSQRPDWFVTPSEGPFRHFWVIGERLSYKGQSRLDFSIEKASYPDMGAVALGPMEGIAIVFITLGIAGAIFILIHASYTLPSVHLPVKIAWTLGSMLLPVLGVILYFNAYRRPFYKEHKMVRWLRPQNIQAASATMMGFGFGAPAMIAVAYLFAWFGFPIAFTRAFSESVFWAGAGMPVMMFGMYAGAIILVIFLVQYPMKADMMASSLGTRLWRSSKVTFLSMTAVSLGMMTVSWWMMMEHLPMMPHEDEILWFGTMWFASFIGFLVAWPLNWTMIRKKLKYGNR